MLQYDTQYLHTTHSCDCFISPLSFIHRNVMSHVKILETTTDSKVTVATGVTMCRILTACIGVDQQGSQCAVY